MKKIITNIASQWSKTSDEEKVPYVKMAQEDSERYKIQMQEFSQTDTFKKLERARKRKHKFNQRVRQKEQKDTMEKDAFELFCQDHGGTKEEIEELWNVTDESMKEDYRIKAFENSRTIITSSRSKRKIKIPSRFDNSVVSSIKTSKISAFENFIKAKTKSGEEPAMDQLKHAWKQLNSEEKSQYFSNTSVDYKALDDGDVFFGLNESDNDD